MASTKKSAKQTQIDRANAKTVLAVSLAVAVAAFSLVSIKSLLSQQAYQSRVIGIEKKALKVAEADVTTSTQLSDAYNAFNDQPTNIIKGSRDPIAALIPSASFSRDGSNSKIVLDALPSKYDFPALVSSLETILKQRGFEITSISGTDDLAQATAAASTSPQPVEMPFDFTVKGSYQAIQDLFDTLDKSIRPISITNVKITDTESNLTLTVSAKSYYQPEKTFNVSTEIVK